MAMTETKPSEALDELRDWLKSAWDPSITLGEWWERLGMAGWSNPLLPEDCYGRGLSRGDGLQASRIIAEHGALGPPQGLGLMLAAPTIATHGTREQIDKYVTDIVTGRVAWCQLFSEPGAGSDLAGLTTKAVLDGDVWHVDGQKVWTSGGHLADMGMLLARTNPDAPKHQGITWFAFDMHQPGVEVRPLKEMTGHAMFSEVFMTDAAVEDANRIGDSHNGWTVANTTLLWERGGMGAGGGGRAPRGALMARPGTIANDLGKTVGDFVAAPKAKKSVVVDGNGEKKKPSSPAKTYIELAQKTGKNTDGAIRQKLAQAHILGEISRLNQERHKAVKAKGEDIAGIANFSKLLMADILRLNRDLGLSLLGARGMLHPWHNEDRKQLYGIDGDATAMGITAQALSAQALPIYGGTDQIQRNLLGERALGLPKEPGDLSHVPFSQLPKNA